MSLGDWLDAMIVDPSGYARDSADDRNDADRPERAVKTLLSLADRLNQGQADRAEARATLHSIDERRKTSKLEGQAAAIQSEIRARETDAVVAAAASPQTIPNDPDGPSSSVSPSAPEPHLPPPRAKDHVSAAPLVEALRGQIAALNSRLERIHAVNDEPIPDPADMQLPPAGPTSIPAGDPAPRNAAAALEGKFSELGQRLQAARKAGASENLIVPIETMLREVLATLHRHDPHAAIERLEGALRALGKKVDSLISGNTSPETLQRIQKQTEEIRDLLTSAATSPFPFQRLEGHLGALADRIALLTTSTSPRLETHRVVESLSDARSQIERSSSATLLGAIGRRLDLLAARVDEALRRPANAPKIDPRPIAKPTGEIDKAPASSEQREDDRSLDAKAEAPRPDLPRAVDETAPAVDSTALTARLHYLTGRLEDAVHRPPKSAQNSPPLEVLALRADGLQARAERQAEVRPQVAKPDPASAPTADSTTLRDLANRLDEVFRQLAPFARLDPKPFEDLAMRIDRVRATVEGHADFCTEGGKLETALNDFGAKLDRQNGWADDIQVLAGSVRELASKREADSNFLQDIWRQVDAKMDAVTCVEIDLRSIAVSLSAANEKLELEENAEPDLRLVEQAADLMAERLGAANHDPASSAAIERAIGELLPQIEATRHELQASATRPPAADLAREIADLRADQKNSERRTLERLSELQITLEKLLDYFGRAEATASSPTERSAAEEESEDRLRDIPDRPAREYAQPPAPKRLIDATNVLFEPGVSAPVANRGDGVEPPGALARSPIDSHIAAARRAAQAALLESAAKKLQLDSSLRASESDSAQSNRPARQRRSSLIGRRRPVLLALALIATATTAAVIEWRVGWPQALRRLQYSTAVHNADPAPPKQEADEKAKSLGTIDYTAVGDVAPPKPKNSDPVAAKPAPAELVAAIPASVAQNLRDQAAAGDPGAEIELALRYIDGRTVAKDPASAARWLELAAVQGLPIAQYRLATLYEKGNGVARDMVLARSWYLKAASAGNARAMHNLGVLIAQDPHDGKPDYPEAAHWFRQAAELGVRDSQFNLGVLYGRGLGVPQDLGQSWFWFSLAAREGDEDAAAKRDEVAAKLDANALAAASKALAEFKILTPSPEANEAPAPAGGWQSGTNERPMSAPPTARSLAAPGASG